MAVVNLTQEHISNGKSHATYCPIALAVKDITNGCYVAVTRRYIALGSLDDASPGRVELELPERAQQVVMAFDLYQDAKSSWLSPCEFELPIPNHFLKG